MILSFKCEEIVRSSKMTDRNLIRETTVDLTRIAYSLQSFSTLQQIAQVTNKITEIIERQNHLSRSGRRGKLHMLDSI